MFKGKILFSRCMFYMSTFKNGISESELEDILSIDDDVLYEIFEYHEPPVSSKSFIYQKSRILFLRNTFKGSKIPECIVGKN